MTLRFAESARSERTPAVIPYLEAETNEGVAAFWGFGEDTSNIAAMHQAQLPIVVRCQVRIPKQAGRHAIWIPWSSPLFLSPVSQEARPVIKTFDTDAARDELSQLGRVLGSVLDRIEAQASTEGCSFGEGIRCSLNWLASAFRKRSFRLP